MTGRLQEMLDAQEDLQLQMPPHRTAPKDLSLKDKGEFFRSQAFALDDEIHEAGNEISWKPWASGEFLNREQYAGELIDAWHFLMNLMLLVGMTEEEIYEKYMAKRQKNIQRQMLGYDGVVGKCSYCHRDLEEAQAYNRIKSTDFPNMEFCDLDHLKMYRTSQPLIKY